MTCFARNALRTTDDVHNEEERPMPQICDTRYPTELTHVTNDEIEGDFMHTPSKLEKNKRTNTSQSSSVKQEKETIKFRYEKKI